MKTQVTASAFWTLFENHQEGDVSLPSHEQMRHKAILGFTAIDAAINTYWKEVLVPEWGEFMSLINAVLEDEEELNALSSSCSAFLKKSQLVASLRFLSHTGEPEAFSPNFVDMACVILLHRKTANFPKLAALLADLQKQRNAALHTGRNWSEPVAFQAIKNIKACSESLSRLHFCFADAFGAPQEQKAQIKLVA